MNCKQAKENLLDYVENKLPLKKMEEITEHLSQCNECTKIFGEIRKTFGALNIKEEIEPVEFFAENVLNKIDSIQFKKTEDRFGYDYLFSEFFKKLAVSGAAFLVLLVLFFYATEGTFTFNFLSSPDDDLISSGDTSELFFDNSN